MIPKRTHQFIDNWAVTSSIRTKEEPSIVKLYLTGIIEHPFTGKKVEITTSSILCVSDRLVTTRTGVIYRLGNINKTYRKYLKANYPDWDYTKPISMITKEINKAEK